MHRDGATVAGRGSRVGESGHGPFTWVKMVRGVPIASTPKLVLFVLATYADQWGTAYPGQTGGLAAGTGLRERAIRDALKYLRDAGLVHRRPERSEHGTDVYVLCEQSLRHHTPPSELERLPPDRHRLPVGTTCRHDRIIVPELPVWRAAKGSRKETSQVSSTPKPPKGGTHKLLKEALERVFAQELAQWRAVQPMLDERDQYAVCILCDTAHPIADTADLARTPCCDTGAVRTRAWFPDWLDRLERSDRDTIRSLCTHLRKVVAVRIRTATVADLAREIVLQHRRTER